MQSKPLFIHSVTSFLRHCPSDTNACKSHQKKGNRQTRKVGNTDTPKDSEVVTIAKPSSRATISFTLSKLAGHMTDMPIPECYPLKKIGQVRFVLRLRGGQVVVAELRL